MDRPKEMEHPKHGKYLKDAVYGASDGIVSTFAVAAGVSGASLNPVIVLILGFANLIADGISMAAGNYLGNKSEQSFNSTERGREYWEVKHVPEEEKEEITKIYRHKGFKGKLLHDVVRHITSSKKRWVDEMMIQELGIIEEKINAKKAAAITFFSFLIAGFVPLISFVLAQFFGFGQPFPWAIGLTIFALFIVGVLKSNLTGKHPLAQGFQMVLVGGIASLAAYYIGYFISNFI